jgi:hypothetical protein
MTEVEVVHEDVKVLVKTPSKKDNDDAHMVYIAAWRQAAEKGAVLREKINEFLEEQGLWDKKKQAKYEQAVKQINEKEILLRKGGIPLKKAKGIALELKRLRDDFRNLIADRTSYDSLTAEGVADNAKFDYLVTRCVVDPNSREPVFKDLDDYNQRGSEPWAVKAASQLANIFYGLDPEYEKNLPENQFLKKFKMTDDKGRLVNTDGHLVAVDKDGKERLIDESGFYIAYDESGVSYKVDVNGEKVEEIVEAPFTDDEGNPVSPEETAP